MGARMHDIIHDDDEHHHIEEENREMIATGTDGAFMERIGRIVAVSGGRAVIMLDPAGAMDDNPSPEIGTLLKVDTDETVALALVSSLSSPMPEADADSHEEARIVEVEFIGELGKAADGALGDFRRGVSQYPGLGAVVGRASHDELEKVYACDGEAAIKVGVIHQDQSIPAMVKMNEMLGKHFAILGTTGTGKSCSVALILRRVLEGNPNAHILLLDMHHEYATAFPDLAEVISPETLNLPFWLLNFEEICEILIGDHANREEDTEVLRELIPQARARYRHGANGRLSKVRETADAQNIGVDAPLPYRASDLIALLDTCMGKLDLKNNLAPYKRIKAKLEAVTRDPRYAFMFGSLTVNDNMAEVVGRLFRIPVAGRPITVLELGGLPSEVINVVVSVLARMAFDFGYHAGGKVPLTFVCEEAHRYVPNDPNAGFAPTRRAISKIAKEGRKYGVSLCIITQRPSELDPTILSQCNTLFSLRLSNERDQEILRAGISDSAASLLDFMPTMGVGEAIAIGEGISLPCRIRFDRLPAEHLPRSSTAAFSEHWRSDVTDPNFLRMIISRWRQEDMEIMATTAAMPESMPPPPAAQPAPPPAPAPAPQPEPAMDRPAAAPQPRPASASGGGEAIADLRSSLSDVLRKFREQ
ncbi:MAG TPA: DUF87 domain-containing protein [Thermopetrobacter sp.]|nr:DUF87 domain-containing protein [Thermopetrobacter sp.]